MTRGMALAAALAMLIIGAPAVAADFTFNVPVIIENMPAARQFQVLCAAYDTADGTGTAVNTIGSWGSPRITVSGGRYSGPPVTVEFSAVDTRAPSEARSYSCNVVIFGVSPDGRAFEAGGSVFASTWRARTGQTVTLDPAYVRGPIPR
jgi:hypothetical protein